MNAQNLGMSALKWTRRAVRLGIYLVAAASLAIGVLKPSAAALAVLLLIVFSVQLGTCMVIVMDEVGAHRTRVRPLITAVCWTVTSVVAVAIAGAFIPNPTAADFIYVALVAVPPLLLVSVAIVVVLRVGRARGWWRRQGPAGSAREV